MLALTRKKDESIMIGDHISIKVLEVKGDKVRIGIEAPAEITIYREEIYLQIQEENQQALKNTLANLKKIKTLIK